MNLYLFELSGKTLLGYVKKEDLINHQGSGKDTSGEMNLNYFNIEDLEDVTVYSPAILLTSAFPVPGNIQVPNKQQEMRIAPVLLPYFVGEMILFIGNIMAVSEIPEDHFFREEMKRIILHFKRQSEPNKKFIPKVVQ